MKPVIPAFAACICLLMVCALLPTKVYADDSGVPYPVSTLAPEIAYVGCPISVTASAYDDEGNLTDFYLYSESQDDGTGFVLQKHVSFTVSDTDPNPIKYREIQASWTPPHEGRYRFLCALVDKNGKRNDDLVDHDTHISAYVDVINPSPIVDSVSVPRYANKGDSVTLVASVSDPDGNMKNVRFYYRLNEGAKTALGTAISVSEEGESAQVSQNWTPPSVGDYEIFAQASDYSGYNSTNSFFCDTAELTVVNTGASTPPYTVAFEPKLNATKGEYVYLSVKVADLNGDLSGVRFMYDEPDDGLDLCELASWIPVSGTEDSAGILWKPETLGTNRIFYSIFDLSGHHTQPTVLSDWTGGTEIEVIDGENDEGDASFMVQGLLDIGNGESHDVVFDGPIGTSGTVKINGSGSALFWSSKKIVLGPGFEAKPGDQGFFFAAIDSDMDGRTDQEENQDLDGDGILDGYEYEIIDHSFSDAYISLSQINGSDDYDGDSISNAQEIANGSCAWLIEANAGQVAANEGDIWVFKDGERRKVTISNLEMKNL